MTGPKTPGRVSATRRAGGSWTLEDSAGAVDLALSTAELARLDAAAPPGATAGPRYGELYLGMLDR